MMQQASFDIAKTEKILEYTDNIDKKQAISKKKTPFERYQDDKKNKQ